MFEATFKIAALVTSNEQGQRVFQVLKHGEPVDDDGPPLRWAWWARTWPTW
jgi:hypothetical protein